jgi:hypothetical protein
MFVLLHHGSNICVIIGAIKSGWSDESKVRSTPSFGANTMKPNSMTSTIAFLRAVKMAAHPSARVLKISAFCFVNELI